MKIILTLSAVFAVFICLIVEPQARQESARQLADGKSNFEDRVLSAYADIVEREVSSAEKVAGPALKWIGDQRNIPASFRSSLRYLPDECRMKLDEALERALLVRLVVNGEADVFKNIDVEKRAVFITSKMREARKEEARTEALNLSEPFARALAVGKQVTSIAELDRVDEILHIKESPTSVLTATTSVAAEASTD